jgi:hypothetical protein
MSCFDWFLNRAPYEYFLCKATIKRVDLKRESEPHVLIEELKLIKARDVNEADAILHHYVQRRQTSWCAYFVDKCSFEVALSKNSY